MSKEQNGIKLNFSSRNTCPFRGGSECRVSDAQSSKQNTLEAAKLESRKAGLIITAESPGSFTGLCVDQDRVCGRLTVTTELKR